MSDSRLADELAIRNLVARYADAATRRDAKAWASLWAEDAEWLLLGNAARGRDEIVALLQSFLARLSFVVQIPGSGSVDVGDGCARGRWTVTEHAKGADGAALRTLGVYEDEYVRVAGEWRFQRRRLHVLYMGPPDLGAEPHPVDS